MKLSQLRTPSKYLSAEDLRDKQDPDEFISPVVTIAGVSIERVGDTDKGVMSFKNIEKKLVLKDVLLEQINEALGTDDTDEMVGQRIQLYKSEQLYQGKNWPVVRIKKAKAKAAPAPVVAAKDDDDDLPF